MWIVDFSSETDNPLKNLPFVPITHLCCNDMLPDLEFPWHCHKNDYEIGFILRGKGLFVLNEKETPVIAGDICVTPPGMYHHFAASDQSPMVYLVIRFNADEAPGSMQEYFRKLGPAITSGDNYLTYIQECANLLLNIHVSNGGHADERIQSICLSMIEITRMLMENSALAIRTTSDYSMNDVLMYITEHCNDKITLQSLSEKFCISPSHLSRLFSKAYNCSPINYLINARILRATEYLGKTSFSISRIAELVGYDNPFYFGNLFLKRVGCSPKEYRERLQNHDVPKPKHEIFLQDEEDEKQDP